MKAAQKWEEEYQMKIHNNRIKQARNQRRSPKTRDLPRDHKDSLLKAMLKENNLQKYFQVNFK